MPTILFTIKDPTVAGDVPLASGEVQLHFARTVKLDYVRTGIVVPVAIVNGTGTAELDVTAAGEAYKIVEHWDGGDGSGRRYVTVKADDTRYEQLTVVAAPGASLPDQVWEENLDAVSARVDVAVQSAESATAAVAILDGSLAPVAKSGAYGDLSGKPTIPSVAGLASQTYVDTAVAAKADSSTVSALATTVGTKASTTYVDNAVAAVPGATDAAVAPLINSPLTKAALDAGYPSKQAAFRALNVFNGGSIITTRSGNPGVSAGFSNGTDTGLTTRIKHKLVEDPGDLWVLYDNSGNGGAGLNDITLKCGIELPDGTILPARYNGAATATLGISGRTLFGPVSPPPSLVKGNIIWSRTYVTVTSGLKWPLNCTTSNSGEGTVATDMAYSGTIPSTFVNAFIPACILSTRVLPSVGICGDSIAAGQADSGFGAANDPGYIQRACSAANIGYISSGKPGETAVQFVTTAVFTTRFPSLSACTDIVFQHGINDVNSGVSLATMKANAIALWGAAKVRGARAWQTTITPSSTSSNTVPAVNDAVRTQFNDWLRDGAPMLAGVGVATGSNVGGTVRFGSSTHPGSGFFEIADIAETARNSGLWKVGYSTDGTHPNGTGCAALMAGIVTSRFTA